MEHCVQLLDYNTTIFNYSFSQEAVTAEQKSLGGKVETLLSWLRETEAQMDGGMSRMEKMDKAEKDDNHDQLTQQLNLCKVSCLNFLIILNFEIHWRFRCILISNACQTLSL